MAITLTHYNTDYYIENLILESRIECLRKIIEGFDNLNICKYSKGE